ncbi:hypothetical protein ONS95_000434 [Cadophora gregata]|uniref:uncharacterized protein n=1 Tax=Cadophora gregata TaxID=51156 RepID=UPI0026DAC142|nr:uncharacterized protein ONS95_000434 [Cadophora gregata]KAK0125559.1 hypothetical protein ONS96_009395 [Cadophora gregata f. sp. sojae]KAK0128462.1 hypothetical protein ONS95_000434 [Cadophora gregata]
MAVFLDFFRKDKRTIPDEFLGPQDSQQQKYEAVPLTYSAQGSAHTPKSQLRAPESSVRKKSHREILDREKSFADEAYMRNHARWRVRPYTSETLSSHYITDRRKHPRPRRPRDLLETNRLRLQAIATKQLRGGVSHSPSCSDIPEGRTATPVAPDVHVPNRLASVRRKKGVDNLREVAAYFETAAREAV